MSSAQPTDLARLELFLELVDEYERLAEAFPVSETFTFPVSASHSVERWPRLVRAFALRKFTLATGDNV